jgi:AcrR family transcriptional regulator
VITGRTKAPPTTARWALYHHFEDKRDLFLAVLERVEDGLVARIAEAAAPATRPEDALRLGGGAVLRAAASDPAVRRIALLDAPAALGWARWREVEERYGLGLIKATLERARPPIGGAELSSRAHVLLAALIELGLLVAHADAGAAAAEHAQATYERVVAAALAPGDERAPRP